MPKVERPWHQVGADIDVGSFAPLHFDPNEFNSAIEDHGQGVVLRRQVRCPCVRPESPGRGRGNCPHCKGLGRLYPASQEVCTIMLLQSRRPQENWQQAGTMTQGPVSATFVASEQPGVEDLVVPDDEMHVVHEVIRRSPDELGDVDPELSNRGVVQRPAPRVDRLLYDDIEAIELVTYISPHPGHPDEQIVEAVEGTDYTRTGDRIVWVGSSGPRPGDNYSIRYRAQAAYIVQLARPRFRSEQGVQMPWAVEMLRYDKWAKETLRR